MSEPMWTLEQGLAMARRLEPIASKHGAHVALGGSVLHSGESTKDLDIFVYCHDSYAILTPKKILQDFGADNIIECNASDMGYAQMSDRSVFMTTVSGKRVDFFFLE